MPLFASAARWSCFVRALCSSGPTSGAGSRSAAATRDLPTVRADTDRSNGDEHSFGVPLYGRDSILHHNSDGESADPLQIHALDLRASDWSDHTDRVPELGLAD
uniref:Putative secreted protein n=1 Tax=Anopheles darlingi TaxID=43151 RepID=A0A2M4DGF9_ANODA